MRQFLATLAAVVCTLVAPLAARASTVTIAPTADAFVRAQAPTTNFGTVDFLDSHGGFGSYTCGSDQQQPGAAYAYLKFDLSSIPHDAVIQSAEVVLTSRTGFAWDGDPAQHLRFVGDDSWTEDAITYRDSPAADGEGYLASREIFYGFPVCGDPKGSPQPQAFTGEALTQTVADQSSGDGTLSLQVYNPNCAECSVGSNLGYWVRFYSREAADPNVRPELVVTYAESEPPVLYAAIPDKASDTTTVVGRVTSTPSTSLNLRFYTSDTCTDGQLGGEPSLLGTLSDVSTDESGDAYFAQRLAGAAPPGSFVAVTAREVEN